MSADYFHLPSRPGDPGSVDAIMERLPALRAGASLDEIAMAFLEDPRHDYLVLVDTRRLPVALADRAALLHAEPYEKRPTTVKASTRLCEAARAAIARPPLERFDPVVCIDASGRYLGAVRVDGLLQALAARAV